MNQLYGKGKEAILAGAIDWENDDIRAILIDTGDYTPDFSTDENLDDIASGGRVGTAVALTGKTNTLGVLDANDVTFTSVTGDSIEAIVLYLHTGTESTSTLLAYIDGRVQVEVGANALSAATSISTEDLPAAIDGGATLTKISGTGPSTIMTSASGAEGARSLSVSALSTGITAGALYEYTMSGAGLPYTPPGGGDIKIAWSDGALKILSL
jgi:hypothetical protein